MGQRATPRSDVFSLGALLFTLATGKLIRDPTIPPWMEGDAENPATRVAEMRDLPGGLTKVLRNALNPDPARRPADAGAFATALAPFMGELPSALAPGDDGNDAAPPGAPPIPYAAAADTRTHFLPPTVDGQKPGTATAPTAEATEATPSHLLQTTGGSTRGVAHPLNKSQIKVGRDVVSDIVLDDLSVSALHALIVKRGERFFIDDQDSSNGIRVNGIGVPSAFLRKGDHLVIGLVGFLVVGSDEDVDGVRSRMLAAKPPRQLTEGQRAKPVFQGLSYSDGAVIGAVCAIVGAAVGYLIGR